MDSKAQLIAVIWDDAHGSRGTIATHEVEHKPYRFTAVGFLIKSDEVGVSVAFEQGEDERWRDVTFIPRAMVVDELLLGPLKKRRVRKVTPVPSAVSDASPGTTPSVLQLHTSTAPKA